MNTSSFGFDNDDPWSEPLSSESSINEEGGLNESEQSQNTEPEESNSYTRQFKDYYPEQFSRESPIGRFFGQFETNYEDPFKAAKSLARDFTNKITTLETEQLRAYTEYITSVQASRLQNSLTTFREQIKSSNSIYKTQTGFISRPTHRDYYNLFASEEAMDMNLRMSFYQIANSQVESAISQRLRGSTEIVTQMYSPSPSSIGVDPQKEATRMNVLLGNNITQRVLGEDVVTGVTMSDSANLHPKVGYLEKDTVARTAFLGTQNITGALNNPNTVEELFIVRSKGAEGQRLVNEIKGATDAILAASRHYNQQLKEGELNLTSASLREDIKRRYESDFTNKQTRALMFNQDVQENLSSVLVEATGQKDKKVVLAVQFLENLFRSDNSSAKVNPVVQMNLRGGNSYAPSQADNFDKMKASSLQAIVQLASEGRLKISMSGTSYGHGQGLFSLLDDYHAGKLDSEGSAALKVLLENDTFSLAATQFMHSKSYAVFKDGQLDEYGISSSNYGKNAYLNNVELGMKLTREQLRLLEKEGSISPDTINSITGYYSYGLTNLAGGSGGGLSMSKIGSSTQVQRAMEIFSLMGGKQSRNRADLQEAPFTYAARYQTNGAMVGLDIQLAGQYSFGVTIGEQKQYRRNSTGVYELKAEPVVYLNKTNRAITGAIFKNSSSSDLQIGSRYIKSGETIQLNALEVLQGMVATLQHSMEFEKRVRSVRHGVQLLSGSGRVELERSTSNVLGRLLLDAAQEYKGTQGIYESKDADFRRLIPNLMNKENLGDLALSSSELAEVLGIVERKLRTSSTKLGFAARGNLEARNTFINSLFSELKSNLAGGTSIGSNADILVSKLTSKVTSTILSSKPVGIVDLYSDIAVDMISQNSVAHYQYQQQQREAKRQVFSQITDIFQQPHEQGYSYGQSQYSLPVYGVTDGVLTAGGIETTGGVVSLPGYILSHHMLQHGEELGPRGSYIRGIADTARPDVRNLADAPGGIFKSGGGNVLRLGDVSGLMRSMPGLGSLSRSEYRQSTSDLYSALGLLDYELLQKEAEDNTFALFDGTGVANAQQILYLFPFAKTEQISQRLKNLRSTRPLLDSSKQFKEYTSSFGFYKLDNLEDSNILGGDISAALPEQQFLLYREYLDEERSRNSNLSEREIQIKVLERVRNESGNLDHLSRGLMGGSAPRRVLISTGISQMSDFAYLNAKAANQTGYVHTHRIQKSLDTNSLGVSGPQALANLKSKLLPGSLFVAQNIDISDRGIVDALLNEFDLETRKLTQEPNTSFAVAKDDVRTEVLDKLKQKYKSISFRFDNNTLMPQFSKGVYSPNMQLEGLAALAALEKIGDIEQGHASFYIDGTTEYVDISSNKRRAQPLKFRVPAFSRREYEGISVLTDLNYEFTGGSTVLFEMNLRTHQDFKSLLRPGSTTNKGPFYAIESEVFDYLGSERQGSMLPQRIAMQDVFAILAPGQIKGFNFESGLTLLEDPDKTKGVRGLVNQDAGGRSVAEALSLLMLGQESVRTNLQSNLSQTGRTQFAAALQSMDPDFAKGLTSIKQKSTNPLQPTLEVYSGLHALVFPEYKDLGFSKGLEKTVSVALSNSAESEEVRSFLQKNTSALFEYISTNESLSAKYTANGYERLVFNESNIVANRSAGMLAFLLKASQDLYADVDIESRLQAKGLSELSISTESLFTKLTSRSKDSYELASNTLKSAFDSFNIPVSTADAIIQQISNADNGKEGRLLFEQSVLELTQNKDLPDLNGADLLDAVKRNSLGYYTGIDLFFDNSDQGKLLRRGLRMQGTALKLSLPTEKEVEQAMAVGGDTLSQMQRSVELQMMQMRGMLQSNRFIELPQEISPSKIYVSTGMENKTALEGHYANALTHSQLKFYTDNLKEYDEVASLQRTMVTLGMMLESGGLTPLVNKSKYSMTRLNLLLLGNPNLKDTSAKSFINAFNTTNEFLMAYSTLSKTPINSKVFGAVSSQVSPAEQLLGTFVKYGDTKGSRGQEQIRHMMALSQIASGVVTSGSASTEATTAERVSLFAKEMERKFKKEPGYYKRSNYAISKIEELINTIGSIATEENLLNQAVARPSAQIEQAKQRTITRSLDAFSQNNEGIEEDMFAYVKGVVQGMAKEKGSVYRLLESKVSRDDIINYIAKSFTTQEGVDLQFGKNLTNRINGSKLIDPGSEYLEGLEQIRSFSKAQINQLERRLGGHSKATPQVKDKLQRRLSAAKGLYESISRTFEVVLPQIDIVSEQSGVLQAVVRSTDRAPAARGLILGLDVMQKMSLVYQDHSHEALRKQQRLRGLISENQELIAKISGGLASNYGLVDISTEEYARYITLQSEIIDATKEAQGLLSNEEAIRRAASDRLGMAGASYIAVSSFLVDKLEVAVGRRFDSVLGLDTGAGMGRAFATGRLDVIKEDKRIQKEKDRIRDAYRSLDEKYLSLLEERKLILTKHYNEPERLKAIEERIAKFEKLLPKQFRRLEKLQSQLDIKLVSSKQVENQVRSLRLAASVAGYISSEQINADITNESIVNLIKNTSGGAEYQHKLMEMLTGRTLKPNEVKDARAQFEYRVYGANTLVGRQGAPADGGTMYGLSHKLIDANKEVSQRSSSVSSFITPDSKASNTLALISAIGYQFTALGDYDGDSFQIAVGQLAKLQTQVSELILDIEKQERAYEQATDRLRRGKQQIGEKLLDNDYAAIRAKRDEAKERLEVYRSDLISKLEDAQQLSRSAETKGIEGLRKWTSSFVALPSSIVGDKGQGRAGAFGDEMLNTFVKQYRDTLAGLFDASGATQEDLAPTLAKITGFQQVNTGSASSLSVQGDMSEVESRRINTLVNSYVSSSNNIELATNQFMHMDITEQQNVLASYEGVLASARQTASSMSKLTAGSLGSQIDGTGLHEVQTIVGASGTGLLGQTYNAIVPLLAISSSKVANQRVSADKEFKDNLDRQLLLGIDNVLQDKPNEKVQKHLQKLKGIIQAQIDSKSSVAPHNDSVQVTNRFLVTIQQFLRDAALKPKEKGSVLEAAREYTVENSRFNYINENNSAEPIKGLANILDAAKDEDRQAILSDFLGTRVGKSLAYSHTSGKSSLDTQEMRGFAALQLIREYVSGKQSATELLHSDDPSKASIFAPYLRSIQDSTAVMAGGIEPPANTTRIPSPLTAQSSSKLIANPNLVGNEQVSKMGDDDFMKYIIADTVGKFQAEFIYSSVLEGDKNVGIWSKGVETLKSEYLNEDKVAQRIQEYKEAYNPNADQLNEFTQEQQDIKQIISTSLQETEGQSIDDQNKVIFRSLIEYQTSKQTDTLIDTISDLRSFNQTISKIQNNQGDVAIAENMEQYTLAISQQLGRGKLDPGLIHEMTGVLIGQVGEHLNSVKSTPEALGALNTIGISDPEIDEYINSIQNETTREKVRRAIGRAMTSAEPGKKSYVETIASKHAFTAASTQLNAELLEAREQYAYTVQHNMEQEQKLASERIMQLEQEYATLKEQGTVKRQTFDPLSQILNNTYQEVQAQINNADIREYAKELQVRETKARRINTRGEVVSMLATPIVFGMLSGEIPVDDKLAAISSDILQSALTVSQFEDSALAASLRGEKNTEFKNTATQMADAMQFTRIRNFMRSNENQLLGAAQGLAFEATFAQAAKASSYISRMMTSKLGAEAAEGLVGRSITEVLAGAAGMTVANLLTNRQVPGTDYTSQQEMDMVLDSLRNINASVNQAAEQFLSQVISGDSDVDAYYEETGEELSVNGEGDISLSDNPVGSLQKAISTGEFAFGFSSMDGDGESLSFEMAA